MTDDELWALVVSEEKAMDEAVYAQRAAPDEMDLAQRAALRDRAADATLAFTRQTIQWQKRARGES